MTPASTAASVLATAQAVSLWQWIPSRAPLAAKTFADDVDQRGRQHAAVGVAQDDHFGARFRRRAHHLEGVLGSGAVAVEEVLGVEEDPPALADEVGDRVADHREVLGTGRLQRPLDVAQVALGDEADHGRLSLAQRGHLWVVGRNRVSPPGGTEGGQGRGTQRELALGPGEELSILRVGARPSALDEPDSEIVEVTRDRQLVGDRKRQSLLLRAIAQGRVIDVESLRVVRKAQGVGDGHSPMISRRGPCARRVHRPSSLAGVAPQPFDVLNGDRAALAEDPAAPLELA